MSDRPNMPNALLDDIAKLSQSLAGVAQGARDEAEVMIRSRIDRWFAERDFVSREEFDAVREMAREAREENIRLAEKLSELESRLPSTG
ncbi:MAG: accessory factor UbiK family protein [Pseudomonadota bacterium]